MERRLSATLAADMVGFASMNERDEARTFERLRAFLSGNIGVLAFEAEDAGIAGDLRAQPEARGTPIGPYDLLIAAQAVRTGATLVTANAREFGRVRGLACQDWGGAARR